MFKTYILLLALSTATYFGVYGTVQGLENVSMVFLWIFTIVLFIIAFIVDDEKRKQSKKKHSLINRYIARLWFMALVLALIYGGAIFMGVIWIASIIIARAVNIEVENVNINIGGKDGK